VRGAGCERADRAGGLARARVVLLGEAEAECEANEADGWIDVNDDFTSGDDVSPAHPECECDTEYRVADDKES